MNRSMPRGDRCCFSRAGKGRPRPCGRRRPRSSSSRRARNDFGISRSEERRVGKEGKEAGGGCQAEDGIRDTSVTGVQTCALPISLNLARAATWLSIAEARLHEPLDAAWGPVLFLAGREGEASTLWQAPTTKLKLKTGAERFWNLEIGRASCRERGERGGGGVSSRRRHTRYIGDWSSDVCSSDLAEPGPRGHVAEHRGSAPP